MYWKFLKLKLKNNCYKWSPWKIKYKLTLPKCSTYGGMSLYSLCVFKYVVVIYWIFEEVHCFIHNFVHNIFLSIVLLVRSKQCTFKYIWSLIILCPYSSPISSVALILSTTVTNHSVSSDFTSAAVAHTLPGYKKLLVILTFFK